MEFLSETKFDRLGAFIYSQEEGTPAAEFDKQIPTKEKEKRFDSIMSLQQRISEKKTESLIGKKLKVLVDEIDPSKPDQYIARSEMDAPEVDGVVYITGKGIKVGNFANVRITGSTEYDLIGEVE